MSIISNLFGLKKAADYAKAIEGLLAERATAEARIEQLKEARNVAPFEGGDIVAIQAEIRETEQQLETLDGLVVEATKRKQTAEAHETEQRLTELMGVARADRGALQKVSKKFDTALAQVESSLDEMRRLVKAVAIANRDAEAAGCSHLRIRSPSLPTTTISSIELTNSIRLLKQMSVSNAFDQMAANGRLD